MIATKQSSLKTNDTNAAQIKSLAFEDVSGVELFEETLEAAVSVVEPQSPSL